MTTSPRKTSRWRRITLVLGAAFVLLYLGAASTLWAYYRYSRKIPNVNWTDIAVITRFNRVQQAVGAQYLIQARQYWETGDYAKGLFLGRAALTKRPQDPDARLFLAARWQQVGRSDFACRTLEDGLAFDTPSLPVARKLITFYSESGRYRDLLTLVREKLPALGHKPDDANLAYFQHAEIQSVFEIEGAEAAAALAEKYTALAAMPAAAALLARIDLARDRTEAGLARLRTALEHEPKNPILHDTLVDIALKAGRTEEARTAAERFVEALPSLPASELRLLEVHGTRTDSDRKPWLLSCMRFLARFREQPVALEQLGDLAARRGWSDLAFLLYENAVASGGRDRAFATFYTCSLLATRDFDRADSVWRDLTAQRSAQADSAPALAAMIASGAGREGEALEHVERLRRDTTTDTARRDRLARFFRSFGFAQLAEQLLVAGA